jgi:DNA-binding NtrC family response regulator
MRIIIPATCIRNYFCIVMNTKVLIIEPDKVLKENLEELIEMEGFKVQGVSTVREAKKAMNIFNPNIVVCDETSLKGEFTKFQEDLTKGHKSLPVFIMVFDGTDEKFKKADAYIKMPFRYDELLSKLNMLTVGESRD